MMSLSPTRTMKMTNSFSLQSILSSQTLLLIWEGTKESEPQRRQSRISIESLTKSCRSSILLIRHLILTKARRKSLFSQTRISCLKLLSTMRNEILVVKGCKISMKNTITKHLNYIQRLLSKKLTLNSN